MEGVDGTLRVAAGELYDNTVDMTFKIFFFLTYIQFFSRVYFFYIYRLYISYK